MNIQQAKQEIKDTVRAYLKKTKDGMYEIPLMRQRPVLLMGAPGLGKTAIMRQIAEETGVGFLSYNMTHHTRQSALGLPLIRKEEYGGVLRDVTAYTMSEIVSGIYELMKSTGLNEGILFLDEINCVSETLSPVILQLLQAKVFGRESIPDGWILVAAGNPKEYNRSVRDFDMATLDRVRLIEVEPSFDAWKSYASGANVHGSVLSYLGIHRENFYKAYITADGMNFVTARGWEDLSCLIRTYEELGVNVGLDQISQFIRDLPVAADFANFYEMYKRYETAYMIDDILSAGAGSGALEKFTAAQLDEKIGVIGLLSAKLNTVFRDLNSRRAVSDSLFAMIKKASDKANADDFVKAFTKAKDDMKEDIVVRYGAQLISETKAAEMRETVNAATKWIEEAESTGGDAIASVKDRFFERNDEIEREADKIRLKVEKVYEFLEAAGGDGTQLVLFTTELAGGESSLRFMTEEGCDKFFEYNKKLLGAE